MDLLCLSIGLFGRKRIIIVFEIVIYVMAAGDKNSTLPLIITNVQGNPRKDE